MAGDNRRSTAAQFFMDEENVALEYVSTSDKVVELLNQASLMQRDAQKISNLKQVQELIIHKEQNLLDNFLDEMIAFQTDRSADIRKIVVAFIEEACKKDPELLPKTLPCLQMLLHDENIGVQKKVILVLAPVFKVMIQWLSKAKGGTSDMTDVWEMMGKLKVEVFEMIDSENDGIRTHVVKFLEGIVLVLSMKTPESETPKNVKPENDITLDSIPEYNKYLKNRKLEDEGKKTFELMLQFQASPHISSINLMTVMGSITNLAKQRPTFFGKVVQAFEALQVNLPPTLAKSQVSSVRKNLKMHMLSLLKHQCSTDYITQITTLLTDLGATQSEVMKNMPKVDESKKRKAEEMSQPSKKARIEEETALEVDDDDIGMTPWTNRDGQKKAPTLKARQTAIDITAEDLVPRLTFENVADLVLISMVMLPDTMPNHFQSTYTPIAAAGTDEQIKHIARLLATQLTMAGMGKGIAEIQLQTAAEKVEEEQVATPAGEYGTSPKQLIQTVVGGTTKKELTVEKKVMPPPVLPVRKGIKQFKLSDVTQGLDANVLQEMTLNSLTRILEAEREAMLGNASSARTKLLACLVSQFGGSLKTLLEDFIFDDLRNNGELAFSWVYQEYANCRGFCATSISGEKSTLASYDECLTRLLLELMRRQDQKEAFIIFHRLLLEAPVVTENALKILKVYCTKEELEEAGMKTLDQLILTRPAHRILFLDIILEFSCYDKAEIRTPAINVVKNLFETTKLKEHIEHYAVLMIKLLLGVKPPYDLFTRISGKPAPEIWTEDCVKMCTYLYLGLLPSNHHMIHELATVYTATSADNKRTILRVLENPVKGMGMYSPELLKFVENCPKGSETLVTRVIHILTDKEAPSPDLVERVRDLYHKRVPDVRCLIPVLTGLSKKEVISALSKLIKLNPIVVKKVFNRLLGGQAGESTYSSPLTPAELLVELHNIDPAKCDMKTIIKASNLCFAEKTVYTQEVLAVVMQQLMEQNPMPTLLMRTVLQSLSMYPRLIGLVMNIMQRLITKQVWKQKKVWEGFIKCCQKTKPQSFAVLLQLPAPQLKSAFESSPDLREPLLKHVQSFTPHQRAHIPKSIMTVLEKDPVEEARLAELKLQRENEEKAKKEELEREEKLRKDAEEKVRIEAEERTRKEAEEKRLLEEQLRKEAVEERMRKDAEEKVRREAEEKVRKEAEEKRLLEEQNRKMKEEEVRKIKELEQKKIEEKKAEDLRKQEEKRKEIEKMEMEKQKLVEDEKKKAEKQAEAVETVAATVSEEATGVEMMETQDEDHSDVSLVIGDAEVEEQDSSVLSQDLSDSAEPEVKKTRGRTRGRARGRAKSRRSRSKR